MRSPLWKWWVCGLLLLATMINYMDRLTINLLAKRMMGEFALNERDYGQLESAFAFAFAVGAIVSGWLADRWSVRWLYPAAVLAWSAAGFATGLVSTFLGLLWCRFFLGLAEAANWPCALRTTQKVMDPGERSLGNSILQSGAAIGAVITPLIVLGLVLETPSEQSPEWVARAVAGLSGSSQPDASYVALSAAALSPHYRPGAWRLPFLVIGAVGALWGVLWLWGVRKGDLDLEPRTPSSLIGIVGWLVLLFGLDTVIQLTAGLSAQTLVLVKLAVGILGIGAVIRWLLRSTAVSDPTEQLPRGAFLRRLAVVMILVVSINVPWHFFRAWMPLFLQKQHGFSEGATQLFNSAYYLATAFGSFAAGWAALLLTRGGMTVHRGRLWAFLGCACLMTLSIPAALLVDPVVLVVLLLVIGFASLGLYPNYYSFSQSLTTAHQGKVTGSLGCVNWLAMYVLHGAVGELVKSTGSYSLGVALVGLVPLCGAAFLLLLWGNDPEPQPT